MGKAAHRFLRFPLLLKFLDAHEMLSVQVHPMAANMDLVPAGETPKTEAWVVLEATTTKPDLFRPGAWHHSRKPAPGCDQWHGGGSPCLFHPETRRRCFYTSGDGSHLGRRRRGI